MSFSEQPPHPISATSSSSVAVSPLLYARLHGVVLSGFVWSVWCCDHYQLSPLFTFPLIFTGITLFLWWCFSTTTSTSVPSISLPVSPNPASSLSTGPAPSPLAIDERIELQHVPTISNISASVPSLGAATSVSVCSKLPIITISVFAQDCSDAISNNGNSNGNNSVGISMNMLPTPTDPPPPYSHNNIVNSSDRDHLSGQCMQINNQHQQHQKSIIMHQNNMRYLLRQKLVIHMWGAGACLVALLAWKMVSEIEPTSALLILKLQAPEVVAELAKMPFERLYLLYCWTTIVVAWYVYAIVISILMRTSTVLKYLGESGEGSAGAGINSQEFDNRADMIVETNEELEQKEQRGIRDQEQLEQKHCGNADSNENGHDMEERAQRSVAKVSSLRTKCQPISCQQYLGQPSHKKDTNPTTVAAIKRYRGGPPTNTQKPREISTALLQQVRHEIQIWSLSLWILAPNVPRSFSQQHPQHPQDYSSVNKRDSSTGTRCQARHPQLYSPLDKQDVGNVVLSTASSSVHKMEIDEPEYELVQCEEVLESELTSSMATSTKSQLELETEPGRRRSLDGSDGGNQDPVQDDGKLRGQRIPPLTESQPIKQQPQRSAFMSQSLPDLHAVKRTGPSSIESTLARWSRRALNPDRLGSIFQNYLKRHVSTSRKDRFPSEYDSDVHDYTANDGPLDEGNNQCSDDTEEEEDGPGVAFVIRSSTLPTVRVGLYNADLKRLWTSSGSIHLLPSPEESIAAHSTERGGE